MQIIIICISFLYSFITNLTRQGLTDLEKGIIVPIYQQGEDMIGLSEGTAIALHSIVYINNKNKPATVKEISTKFGISDNHLSKVLQRLVREGILISEKGPKGGFLINDKYKNMSLLEVYEIFEGKFQCHRCLFNNGKGDCKDCIMSDFVTRMDNEFIKYMSKTTVADFKHLPNLNV